MAKKKYGPGVQRPNRGIDPRELLQMTLKDLKALSINGKGKMAYLDELNYVLKEIYGFRKIGTKLLTGKSRDIKRVMEKIDLVTLVKILCDKPSRAALRNAILLKKRIETDASMTEKECRKTLKKIKKVCDIIRQSQKIQKIMNEDDVSVDDLSRFIEAKTSSLWDDDFYYDDDDDDDEDLFKSSDIGMSYLEKYLSGKTNKRRYDDDDDDDYYRYIADDDDDEEDDDDDESDSVTSEIVDALKAISNRLDNLERGKPSPIPNIYPTPAEPAPKSDPQMASILNGINNITVAVGKNNQAISGLGQKMASMNNDIQTLYNQVDKVTGAVSQIMDDLYEEDDSGVSYNPDGDDEELDDSTVVHGQVDMSRVIDAFGDRDDEPDVTTNVNVEINNAANPIRVRELNGAVRNKPV